MAKVCKKSVLDNGVKFAFTDGQEMTCSLTDLPDDIVHKLAIHGLSQKVGDSYASAETVSLAFQAARATWGNLTAGVWAAKSQSGGMLAEVLCRMTGASPEHIATKLGAMSEDELKVLKKSPKVVAALAELRAERARAAAGSGDGDDALDLLGL